MKPAPQGKIPSEVSAAFASALEFMRLPPKETVTLFAHIDAAEAGERTSRMIENVAQAHAHHLMSLEQVKQCMTKLNQLWWGLSQKQIIMPEECKTKITGIVARHLPKATRPSILCSVHSLFVAAGNPSKNRQGVIAREVQSIILQPYRSSLNADRRRFAPVFSAR